MRFPGEALTNHRAVAAMSYFRAGSPDRPLVVFLPGGGHLARIAYGHPAAEPRDFLDFWLERKGCGLLGLSYPTDHAAIRSARSDLTIREWAGWVASSIAKALDAAPASHVIVAMWSMAGRSVRAVNKAIIDNGPVRSFFISLAATPPLPGLIPLMEGGEPLTEDGWWALMPRAGHSKHIFVEGFEAALADQSDIARRDILSVADYHANYLCNTPIMLRGTAQRIIDGRVMWSEEEAIDDMGATQFGTFPLTAAIVPTHFSDAMHVLGDRTAWTHFNIQRLIHDVSGRSDFGSQKQQWRDIRALADRLHGQLSADIAGGHFFFLGETGARETVRLILSLSVALQNVMAEIAAILEARDHVRETETASLRARGTK